MMSAPELVFLAVEPVDMRLGIDGLSLLIHQATGHSPCDGAAYAFRNRATNRIKLLVWDGTGVWLCSHPRRTGGYKPGNGPSEIVSDDAMDAKSDRMAAGAQSALPETGEADIECWREQAHALAEALESTRQDLRLAELKNQKMALDLAYYKRLKYAASSEHYKGEQQELFEQDMEADLAAIQAEPETCTCGQCGGPLTLIRDEVTEQLDIEPGRFFVRRHIRPQYACRACETVVAAPAPPTVIDGGMAAPGLLAWVVTSKYLDHLPSTVSKP